MGGHDRDAESETEKEGEGERPGAVRWRKREAEAGEPARRSRCILGTTTHLSILVAGPATLTDFPRAMLRPHGRSAAGLRLPEPAQPATAPPRHRRAQPGHRSAGRRRAVG